MRGKKFNIIISFESSERGRERVKYKKKIFNEINQKKKKFNPMTESRFIFIQ